jgi:hypothetical protein
MKHSTSAARAHLSGSKSLNLSERWTPTWSNHTSSPFHHDSLAHGLPGQGCRINFDKPRQASIRVPQLLYRNLSRDAILHLSFVNSSPVSNLSRGATHYTPPQFCASLLSGLLSDPYLHIPLFILCRHCSLVCSTPKCIEDDIKYST